MNAIEVVHLGKSFPKREILKDVSFSLPHKGLYFLLGPSGSGKSTFLSLISMIDTSFSGELRIFGHNPKRMEEDERGSFRLKNIGFLRQDNGLLELETAKENVLFPSYAFSTHQNACNKRASDLLREVGLEGKEDARANTLSGGERGRLSLARSLINNPKILLCDEPTGALDKKMAKEMMTLLKRASFNRLVLVVTHDENLAKESGGIIGRLINENIFWEERKEEGKTLPLSIMDGGVKQRKKVSSFPFIRHSLRILKAKKYRVFFFSSILSLSLILLGTSFYLSKNLANEVEKSLSSYIGNQEVLLESRNGLPSYEAASDGEISSLLYQFDGLVDGYGYGYRVDFSSYFPDERECIFPINAMTTHVFTNLNIEDVESFRWLSDLEEETFYPEIPKVLEQEEVVLGLPFSEMSRLCFALRISPSFENLGHYLATNSFEILLRMKNDSWQYEDEQILSVKAVLDSQGEPFFAHLDPFWNEWMLEFKMRFPTSPTIDTSKPWIMEKIPYLHFQDSYENMINLISKKELEQFFLFEPPNESYGNFNEDYQANRLYVFHKEGGMKESVVLDRIKKLNGIESFRIFTQSYQCFPSSFTEGFLRPFFLTKSSYEADLIEDSSSLVTRLEDPIFLNLPEQTACGSYLLPKNEGIRFSSSFKDIKGEEPQSLKEIVLGEELYTLLGQPQEIVSLYPYRIEENKDSYRYFYRRIPLTVVGVIKGGGKSIHHHPYWTRDFFLYEVGLSIRETFPNALGIQIGEKVLLEPYLDYFAGNFPEYNVSFPSLTLKDSLEETEHYLTFFLFFLSIGSFFLATLLLFTTSSLFNQEGKNETNILSLLGFSHEERARNQTFPLLILLISSGITSSFSLYMIEYFLHQTLYGEVNLFLFIPDLFSILLPFSFTLWIALILYFYNFLKQKRQ